MRNFLSRIKNGWSKPVAVIIAPLSSLPSWRFHVSIPFVVFMCALWTGVTLWAGYIAGRHVDYYVTKADNTVLRAKMAFVAGELSSSMKYLRQTRETERQMQSILGLGNKTAAIKLEALGGAGFEEKLDFRRIISKKASEISEGLFRQNISKVGEESKRALASFQEIAWYVANQRNIYKSTPSMWPAEGRLTSSFGYRFSPFGGELDDYHTGIDISNDPNTPIYAPADGVVRHAGWAVGYGQAILIDHGFGLSTLYGHTTQLKVNPGERVKRGTLIALMGNTGRSTGSHLHYEVWEDGRPVNPMKYLKVGGGKKDDEKESLFSGLLGKN
ncbi:MAG: M23 family metallopeptidase [Elusimicrobia bacterium]|nr:M23 family metallopeptidase [Elusimicrobiota bacterium]